MADKKNPFVDVRLLDPEAFNRARRHGLFSPRPIGESGMLPVMPVEGSPEDIAGWSIMHQPLEPLSGEAAPGVHPPSTVDWTERPQRSVPQSRLPTGEESFFDFLADQVAGKLSRTAPQTPAPLTAEEIAAGVQSRGWLGIPPAPGFGQSAPALEPPPVENPLSAGARSPLERTAGDYYGEVEAPPAIDTEGRKSEKATTEASREKVREFIQQRQRSQADERERKRRELLLSRGKNMAVANLAEGLGSFKPSVAADYLLTGGPPEQPEPFAEGPRMAAAEAQDLVGGIDARFLAEKLGIDVGEVPNSILAKYLPMIASAQSKAASSDISQRKWEAKEFNDLAKDFNREAAPLREMDDAARRVRAILESPDALTNRPGVETAVRNLLRQAETGGRFTDRDVQAMLSARPGLLGTWDSLKRTAMSAYTPEWRANMLSTLNSLEGVTGGALDELLGSRAAQAAEAYGRIDPSYDEAYFRTFLSGNPLGRSVTPASTTSGAASGVGGVRTRQVRTPDGEIIYRDLSDEEAANPPSGYEVLD